MPPVHYYNSRPLALVVLVGSLAGVAKGMSWVHSAAWPALGATCVAVFIGCFAAGLWLLLDQRPRLSLTGEGLTDRMLGVGLIPWSDIEEAYTHGFRSGLASSAVTRQQYVCLRLRNEEQYVRRLSFLKRNLAVTTPKLGFTRISINLAGTTANSQQVLCEIRTRIARAQA